MTKRWSLSFWNSWSSGGEISDGQCRSLFKDVYVIIRIGVEVAFQ